MYSVMIVEDEYFVRVGIRTTVDWEALGLTVAAEASGGEEAYALYQQLHPDIIITDLKMAGMDGMTLIEKIREEDQDTRIIILSNLEEFRLVRQAITLNVSDYILKLTMQRDEMHDVLRKVVGQIEDIRHTREVQQQPQSEAACAAALLEHLQYNMHSPQEIAARLAALPQPFHAGRVQLALMEIDNYEEVQQVFDDRYGNLIYTAFSNVIRELLAQQGRGLVLHAGDARYLLLMDAQSSQDPAQAETLFLECLGRVSQVLYTHFNSCITFGVSTLSSGPEELRALYTQAEKSLAHRFYHEVGACLLWREEEKLDTDALLRARLRDAATQRLPAGRLRDAMLEATAALPAGAGHAEAEAMLLGLAQSEAHRLGEAGVNATLMLREFDAQLQASQTLGEMLEVFCRFVQNAYGGAGGPTGSTILRVIDYIHTHYKENLTLEQMAAEAGLSKNYLCSFFKKETGVNLTQYILSFRVARAKELLRNSNMKSYEIGDAVGFSNESYFSRSFKKVVGQSPADYHQHATRAQG